MDRSKQLAQLFVVFLPYLLNTKMQEGMQLQAANKTGCICKDYQSTTAVLIFEYQHGSLAAVTICFNEAACKEIIWAVGTEDVLGDFNQLDDRAYVLFFYAVKTELEKFLRRNIGKMRGVFREVSSPRMGL